MPELGLYSYRARWYDPMLVNFIERDPAGYADSPNLMQAFGYDPVSRGDPFGLWTFDFSKVPGDAATYQLLLQEVADAARTLLLDPLTRRYLRRRFGDAAANEAYLRNIASVGTPPRVVYEYEYFDSTGLGWAAGAWDPERSAIFIKPYRLTTTRDPGTPCGRRFSGRGSAADRELCTFMIWTHAALLVHETIHFIDSDTGKEPAVDAVTDWDRGIGGYDTGDKWEYFLFASPVPPDEQSSEATQEAFFIWLKIFRDPQLRRLFAQDYENRWRQILDWLAMEEARGRRAPKRGGTP